MARPPSIVRFEQLYLASIAVWLFTTVSFWSLNRRALETSSQYAANPSAQSAMAGLMIGTASVVLAASLLFWWLAARRAHAAGKWMILATEAVGALLALYAIYGLFRGAAPNTANLVLNLLATGLAVAAALMLLRPDANAWFAEGRGEPEGPQL